MFDLTGGVGFSIKIRNTPAAACAISAVSGARAGRIPHAINSVDESAPWAVA
jgi:hypothetical protein